MKESLKILMVEDVRSDAGLVLHELRPAPAAEIEPLLRARGL
jgi:hypothetical protein